MECFEYAVKLTSAEEGGFVVTCRDLPQLVTQGEEKEEALREAADAMDEVFAAYMLGDLPFPVPSKAKHDEYRVSPPAETLAKAGVSHA
jgi:antitoxin HicB